MVLILRGKFKGQTGRVTHIHGDIARIELSVMAKQQNIHLDDIQEAPKDQIQNQTYAPTGTGGGEMSQYGGQTAYGGASQYEAGGKTAMMANTPAYMGMTPGDDYHNPEHNYRTAGEPAYSPRNQ